MISMSSEEKNYYEIGRKHCKSEVKGQDEKNFITMTTKTILFDAEQPRESVVKHTINVPLLKKREKLPSTPASYIASHPKSEKHENSLKNVTETPTVSSPGDQISSQMNSACCDSPEESKDARPSSRLGFVAVESDADNQESAIANTEKQHVAVNQRPPSSKRQLKSSDKKAPNTDLQNTPSCPTSKGSRVFRRPLSASAAIGQPPSGADARRASEAAKALRQAKEEACQHQTAAASRFQETRRHYGSYGSSRPPTGHQKNAMSYTGQQIVLKSKMPDDEFETETSMECREMQKRLACYGIDVKAETLERALFPPSGKTLYYEVTAKLPQSNSDRLLSHPRFWLPEEHKRLRLAEKKLGMITSSLY
ncbi:hypothetical protein C0Q70_17943 [Pomacea canaliculata]|uniref:Uncharacterized protein n=1 Tax=Pomacea canaliculata TaxID=400727 RepID=A0A2T7NLV0_POMCA|nr:hypothetical protein C0Q70_17943 [Pomacea canaliculata]